MATPSPSALAPKPIALIAGLIVLAALSRLAQPMPNFTPIEALGLFAGAHLADRRLALLLPLGAMLLSDLFLGIHALLPLVYACLALNVWLGTRLGAEAGYGRILGFGLFGAVVFFVVTNFAVWLGSGMYPPTLDGLLQCYVAALPFFRNSIAGMAVYTLLLFGLYRWLVPQRARSVRTV